MTALLEPIQDVEDGIYPDVEDSAYRAWPRPSGSSLWYGVKESEAHMRAALDGTKSTDSDAKKFGRDVHTRLLEPAKFKDGFVSIPDYSNDPENCTGKGVRSTSCATSYVKCKEQEFRESNTGKEIISIADMAAIEYMAKAVYRHPVCQLFHAAGGCEVAIAATLNGVKVKGKVDKLIQSGMPATIVDIKKIGASASDRNIQRAMTDYGYPFKAGLYVDMVEKVIGERPDFFWVFIEDDYPFDVVVIQLDADSYRVAQAESRLVLSAYQRCMESGIWHGRSNEISEGGYPAWYLKQRKDLV